MTATIDEMIVSDFKNFSNGTGRKKEYMGDLIVIKARGLKNYRLQFVDSVLRFYMYPDPEYGTIKVIFKASYYGEYKLALGDMTRFDTLIIVGLDKHKNVIERVFAIPEKDLSGKRFITITKASTMYQKFEIDKKRYAETYENMKNGKFSIMEDGSIVQ